MRRFFSVTLCVTLLASGIASAQQYQLGADSQPQATIPKGTVTKYTFASSKIFPGTTRDYWVYIPAQYNAVKPACVMVFQDGGGFVKTDGEWRVPVVLDNLIAQKAMPVTVAVFIDPGVNPGAMIPDPTKTGVTFAQQARFNRSFEYDAVSDRWARFVHDEILSEVEKTVKLSSSPDDRAIAGASSGGIAAFAAAWEHPEFFHRVISFIGSFTDLRGGDAYVNLIRKSEPRPLRVFLQDGSNDLNIYGGSWYLANQSMAKSLAYAGYDAKFEVGTEGHNAKQGAAILPEALKWLWRDYPNAIIASKGGNSDRQFVTDILDPGHDWELAGEGYDFAEGLTVDPQGNLFFCDSASSKIFKIAAAGGKVSLFKEGTAGTSGLTFSADGTLYAAETGRLRVASYLPSGELSILSLGVQASDVAIHPKYGVYFSEAGRGRIWLVNTANLKRVVFDNSKNGNIQTPYCVRLLPDGSGLVVTDFDSRASWSFRIAQDGSLEDGEPFYRLEIPDSMSAGPLRSGARGVAFDDQGYSYFATALGIQICDQPGHVVGIIRKPGAGDITDVAFGGIERTTLYVTCGKTVYCRHLRRKGAAPGISTLLPKPQL